MPVDDEELLAGLQFWASALRKRDPAEAVDGQELRVITALIVGATARFVQHRAIDLAAELPGAPHRADELVVALDLLAGLLGQKGRSLS